jgi:hypothetical protein
LSVAQGTTFNPAGKKWVIEGIWRGWDAINRDTVEITHRVIPGNTDFLEFFQDSTFHFNYFVHQSGRAYIKSFWEPGSYLFTRDTNQLTLQFDDTGMIRRFRVFNHDSGRVFLIRLQ